MDRLSNKEDRVEKMRLASIKPNDLAVVSSDRLVPIGGLLARQGSLPQGASMIDLISQYDSLSAS